MGEAVLKDIAKKRGLDITVDSCGTGAYHVGEDPDDRCVSSLNLVGWKSDLFGLEGLWPLARRYSRISI